MEKIINDQYKALMLQESTKSAFNIDSWNRSTENLKKKIKADIKDQLTVNDEHYKVVKSVVNNHLQKNIDKINLYQRLLMSFEKGLPLQILKMVKNHIDSVVDIYEIGKLKSLNIELPKFKSYTELSHYYLQNYKDTNIRNFMEISDYIGIILSNTDYYKENVKKLMEPIVKIIESNDSDDISILTDIANSLEV